MSPVDIAMGWKKYIGDPDIAHLMITVTSPVIHAPIAMASCQLNAKITERLRNYHLCFWYKRERERVH